MWLLTVFLSSLLMILGTVSLGDARRPRQALPAYTFTDLGPLLPQRINDTGVIAGALLTPAQHAALVIANGTAMSIPFLPGGTFSQANSLSTKQIVGFSSTGNFGLQTHAFVIEMGQAPIDLGTLTGDPDLFSAATDVNDTATVSGYATQPLPGGGGDEQRPVAWVGPQIADLGTLGGAQGQARGMNAHGVIVGTSQTANGVWHATRWPVSGTPQDLDTLGSTSSQAAGINAEDVIVGEVVLSGGITRGFRWTAETGMETLSPLPGAMGSRSLAVNAAGIMVGASLIPNEAFPRLTEHATLWDTQGVPINLNQYAPAGWQLTRATAINTQGAIVGLGFMNESLHGWILVPATYKRYARR